MLLQYLIPIGITTWTFVLWVELELFGEIEIIWYIIEEFVNSIDAKSFYE